MTLTKNAIGNLINRYKAVLKKCSLMNTFGSLAVAGMLVMGGVGVAGASPFTIDDTTPAGSIPAGVQGVGSTDILTITSATKAFTIRTSALSSDAWKNRTIHGGASILATAKGAVTVNVDSEQIIDYPLNIVGVNADNLGTLNVTTGKLFTKHDVNVNAYGVLNASSLKIDNNATDFTGIGAGGIVSKIGEVKIAANGNATIGSVSIVKGFLTIGGKLTTKNGITVEGTAADEAQITGVGGTITGDVALTKGTLEVPLLGSMTIDGKLSVAAARNADDTADQAVLELTGTASDFKVKELNLLAERTIDSEALTVGGLTGATLTLKDTIHAAEIVFDASLGKVDSSESSIKLAGNNSSYRAKVTVAKGNIRLNDISVDATSAGAEYNNVTVNNATDGANLTVGTVSLTEGTGNAALTITATNAGKEAFTATTTTVGAATAGAGTSTLTVAGAGALDLGAVTVNSKGTITSTATGPVTLASLTNSGAYNVNAGTTTVTGALDNTTGKVTIASGATLSKSGDFLVAANKLVASSLSAGEFAIASGGTFAVDGALNFTDTTNAPLAVATGGTVAAKSVALADRTKELTIGKGTLAVNGGTAGGTIGAAKVNVGGADAGALLLGGKGEANDIVATGAATANNFKVDTGADWKITSLDASGVTGTATNTVNVLGALTITGAIKNKSGGNVITNAGKLTADLGALVDTSVDTYTTIKSDLATAIASTGTLLVANGGYISLTQLKNVRDTATGGGGKIGVGDGTTIKVDASARYAPTDGALLGTGINGAAEAAIKESLVDGKGIILNKGDDMGMTGTGGDTVTATTGGYTADRLRVKTSDDSAPTSATVTFDNDTTLIGSNNSALDDALIIVGDKENIAKLAGNEVDVVVEANKNLTLGAEGQKGTGTLGNISLTADTTGTTQLEAQGSGSVYTVGDITGGTNTGVSAHDGVTLNTGVIGKTTAVTSVNSSNSQINADGNITAGTIEAKKNGGVSSKKGGVSSTADILATTIQGGDEGNGLVKADGTLTATNTKAGEAGTLTVQSADAMNAGAVSNATGKDGNIVLETTDGAAMTIASIDMSDADGTLSATSDGAMTVTGAVQAGEGDISLVSKAADVAGTPAIKLNDNVNGDDGKLTIKAVNGSIDATSKDITGGTGDVTLSAVNGVIKANKITTGADPDGAFEGAGYITAKTLTLDTDLKMQAGGELNLTGDGGDKSRIGGTMVLDDVKADVNELEIVTFAEMHDMEAGSQFRKLKVGRSTIIDNDSEVAIGDFNPGDDVTIGDPLDPTDNTVVNVQNFIDSFDNPNTLDQQVDVAEGSVLGYGNSSMQVLKDTVAAAATSGAPVDGGVYVAAKPLDVNSGWLNVGAGAAGLSMDDVIFAAGATLAVDQGALGSDAAFLNGDVTLDDGSNIAIVNAKAGAVTIVDNGALNATDDRVRVFTDTDMLVGRLDSANKRVVNTLQEASSLFPGLGSELASIINGMYLARLNDENSPFGGIKFLTRATNNDFLGGDKQAVAKTIEGASRMVATSAPQMAAAANTAGVGAVVARTSIGNLNSSLTSMNASGAVQGANAGDETGMSAGNNDKSGFAMWIMPLWQSVNSFGQKAGEFKSDMHGNIGGVAIGADYTFENALRAGITFNIGGGYAEGSGDFAKTTNNMNFWGIGLYGSWAMDNFGVSADVNYTSTFNKMKQELDSRMGMADLKTDVYSSAITAGLRGEYKMVTDALDITPHLGVRLMYLHTDEYDVKSAGSKVYKGDAINQTIWSFPVGVTLSKTVNLDNGWYVKPSLDLQVTPRAGEVHARNDIKYTGLNTSASIETQTMDYITYGGAAGIEFGNGNLKLGLNYNLEAGAHTTNHGVYGTFRNEF